MGSRTPKTDKPLNITSKAALRSGSNPERDAWLTAFFIENHLDHFAYPEHVASPEQIQFIVHMELDERYYPCSDRMFEAIMDKNQPRILQDRYRAVLKKIFALIDAKIEDPWEKEYLKSLINIKFKHETRDKIMIPSRLEKRLMQIFLHRTQIEDPFRFEKENRNRRASQALNSAAFHRAINRAGGDALIDPPETLTGLRARVEHLELRRLFSLFAEKRLWESEASRAYTEGDFLSCFDRPLTGEGVQPLFGFLGISESDRSIQTDPKKKILWLADEAGEIMIDLAVVRHLTKRGHKIILVVKDGPLFTKVDFKDIREDEVLVSALEGALVVEEKNLSKNNLLRILRSDHHIVSITDGTREGLNLLLTSKTFARTFKEVDAVISRGLEQRRRFFDTHFQFTQDIYNISAEDGESVCIALKPKPPEVIKFSHKDLENRARAIIDRMVDAKKKGMTVIFYSGIIGSIPGRIDMAKRIMSVFVEYLKSISAMTFVINPSEYFEPGMDADDLMYMWEIVQRSGYIDIWRFQTYGDIFQAFQIMSSKAPPEWVGKDATFSTGCTKEMAIATEVQQKHPEMQIIGPAKEKFMRRKEYGLGKMYDERFN